MTETRPVTETEQAPTQRRPKRTSIGGSAIWFGMPYGFALLSYLGVNAIAARLLGTAGFGMFFTAVTLTSFFGQLGLLGAHRSGLRDSARLRDSDDPERLTEQVRSIRAVTRFVLPLSASVAAVGSAFVLPVEGNDRWIAGVAVAALVVGSGFQRLWANYLRGFGYVKIAGLLEGRSGGAAVAVCQLVFIGTVFLLLPHTGMAGALAAMALGYIVPVVLAGMLVTRRWQSVRAPFRPLADLRLAWTRGARFALIQAGSYLNSNVDLWMATALLAATQGSHFAAAQRMVLLLVVPLTSLQVVLSPVISRMYHQGEVDGLQRVVRTATTVITMIVAVFLIPMIVLPDMLLEVVNGAAFTGGAPALMILALGLVVQVIAGGAPTALSMADREGVVARVQTIGIVIRVSLGAVAALTFGMLGLATTAAIGTATIFAILWWQTHRRLGMWTHPTLRPSLRLLLKTSG